MVGKEQMPSSKRMVAQGEVQPVGCEKTPTNKRMASQGVREISNNSLK
jgi:hypothetical protein